MNLTPLGTAGWVIRDLSRPSPVRVPYNAGRCTAEIGWLCTRPVGHTGRHAAAVSTGEVMAVWL